MKIPAKFQRGWVLLINHPSSAVEWFLGSCSLALADVSLCTFPAFCCLKVANFKECLLYGEFSRELGGGVLNANKELPRIRMGGG